ncbi:fumarylacetoacetate hydrolase family protein [Bradyrhizobium sp. Pha-3]|uniref:fumarylacetoacetate hydrolase family protein n=1 Tax=Bradyrhizobium sp. Pha-3 TaxID=208375 RepID=UPI0035D3F2C0
MRFIAYERNARRGLAVADQAGRYRGLDDGAMHGRLERALSGGHDGLKDLAAALLKGEPLDQEAVSFLPPLSSPGKIICVGLNYADHTAESSIQQPDYPTLFGRFSSSLIGHGAPIVRPKVSAALDYEGELVAVIGRGGRHIPQSAALDHVAGYSIFNDGTIRDYQFRTPQWTMGKNFDGTGAFGPALVTADELPPGAGGLTLETRLNGTVMQKTSTSHLIFDVATLVALISEGITLYPGDLIVTGTPSGVGAARKPPLYMKPGDVCEIEIEGLGILRNPIVQEGDDAVRAAA